MGIIGDAIIIPAPPRKLPPEYQAVEYIQTDGVAYINTGVYFNGYLKIHMKFYQKQYTFGATQSNSSNYRVLYGAGGGAPGVWGTNSSGNYINALGLGTNETMAVECYWYPGMLSAYRIDEITSGAKNTNQALYTLDSPFYFLAQNYVGSPRGSSGTQGTFLKMWTGQNYKLVRDYISVRRLTDNAGGMFDFRDMRFYGNAAGSGAFTVGPDINEY